MMSPRKNRYRKQHKYKANSVQSNTCQLCFGQYGIKSLEQGRLKASTIEAVRRAINRECKPNGVLWTRVFPDCSVTSKPLQARMGKGKGGVDYWVSRIKSGEILYEMDGIEYLRAKEAALLAAAKLPLKTALVKQT